MGGAVCRIRESGAARSFSCPCHCTGGVQASRDRSVTAHVVVCVYVCSVTVVYSSLQLCDW